MKTKRFNGEKIGANDENAQAQQYLLSYYIFYYTCNRNISVELDFRNNKILQNHRTETLCPQGCCPEPNW